MKKKYFYPVSIMIILIVISFIGGCKKEVKFHDAIYISGTDKSNIVSLTVSQTGTPSGTYSLSATASAVLPADATVSFAAVPELVDAFNQNSTIKYKLLPSSYYSIPQSSAIIKAGTNVSNSIQINITATADSLTDFYLLPLTISGVTGSNLPLLPAQKIIYLIVVNPSVLVAGDYKIYSATGDGSKLLDVAGNSTSDGSTIGLWTQNYPSSSNQTYQLEPLGNLQYKVRPLLILSKIMTVAGDGSADHSPIQIFTDTNDDTQIWETKLLPGGYFLLSPLSATGSSLTSDGNSVYISATNGDVGQQWKFQLQ